MLKINRTAILIISLPLFSFSLNIEHKSIAEEKMIILNDKSFFSESKLREEYNKALSNKSYEKAEFYLKKLIRKHPFDSGLIDSYNYIKKGWCKTCNAIG